jgi:hypothetical protein
MTPSWRLIMTSKKSFIFNYFTTSSQRHGPTLWQRHIDVICPLGRYSYGPLLADLFLYHIKKNLFSNCCRMKKKIPCPSTIRTHRYKNEVLSISVLPYTIFGEPWSACDCVLFRYWSWLKDFEKKAHSGSDLSAEDAYLYKAPDPSLLSRVPLHSTSYFLFCILITFSALLNSLFATVSVASTYSLS